MVAPRGPIVRDDGDPGASLRRPGRGTLRDLAARAKRDRIRTTDPDRRARNSAHRVLLLEERRRHGGPVAFADRPRSHDPPDRVAKALRQGLRARPQDLRHGRSSRAPQIERLTEADRSRARAWDEYARRRRRGLERRDAARAPPEEAWTGGARRAFEWSGAAVSAEAFANRVRAGLDRAPFERRGQRVEGLTDRAVVTGDDVAIR